MKRINVLIIFCFFNCLFLEAQNVADLSVRATKGEAKAQHELGVHYIYNAGIEKAEEGFKWIKRAAEQNYALAQTFMGNIYSNPAGFNLKIVQSKEESVKWWKKAAEQGETTSQQLLGMCYRKGEGVQKSLKESFNWYTKAVQGGNKYAAYDLGRYFYDMGNVVEYSPKEAFRLYSLAAEVNIIEAYYQLGYCYFEGHGTPISYSKSFNWFEKGAKAGHAKSQYRLGLCYLNGTSTISSFEKAKYWLLKASEQNDNDAKDLLSRLADKKVTQLYEEEGLYSFMWSNDKNRQEKHWESKINIGNYSKIGFHSKERQTPILFLQYDLNKTPSSLQNTLAILKKESYNWPVNFHLKNSKIIKFSKSEIHTTYGSTFSSSQKDVIYITIETSTSEIKEFEVADIDYVIIGNNARAPYKLEFPNNMKTSVDFKKGNSFVNGLR